MNSSREAKAEQLPTGLTAQYQTLARALGYAAGMMEDDLEELADKGLTTSAASLRMEARFVTVTLLSAAMAESLANTILALASNGKHAEQKGRKPNLFVRWQKNIPETIGCPPFLTGVLADDLSKLCDIRNSITHSNPRLFSGDSIIADGNTKRWEQLETVTARMFVQLPLRLLDAVPRTDRYNWVLVSFANDHWLHQAIKRGKGECGVSPNEWRPHTRKGRAELLERESKLMRRRMAGWDNDEGLSG